MVQPSEFTKGRLGEKCSTGSAAVTGMLRRPVETGRKRSTISAAARQTTMLASESSSESRSSLRRLIALSAHAREGGHPGPRTGSPLSRGRAEFDVIEQMPGRRPGEHRLSLLHEGVAALDVVLAAEAGVDHVLHARDVALRLVLGELADH